MKLATDKKKEKPLILDKAIEINCNNCIKNYKYSYQNSINEENDRPFIKTKSQMLDIGTITETGSEEESFYLDLDMKTKND